MCRPGDIIIIKNFKDELGSSVDKHSFIVIDNKKYITSNMMCSFKNDNQKQKKLKYYGNYEIDSNYINGNSKAITRNHGFRKKFIENISPQELRNTVGSSIVTP